MSSVASLAERLQERRPLMLAWCGLPDAAVAALFAREDFDAVLFDMQHGAVDYAEVVRGIPLIAGIGKPALARIPVGEFAMASRLLDAGASAIVAPMINTVDDARRFASFMKFPPQGDRSWGPYGGLALTGLAPGDYFGSANAFSLSFAMIETREAMASVDDILAAERIDASLIGPSDLSIGLSRGANLSPTGAEVDAALDHLLSRARAAGKFAAVYAANGERAAAFAEKGFDLIAVGNDTALLRAGAQAALKAARGATTGGGSKAGY